ncbi:hypothetical protein ABIB90_000365 [Bradyrhizobium sp. JR4.1]|uniref:hypothetical protein n=1 Tax=Bradyrhizobium sp. JR4.1 TaxID=3156372 RepID=UPI003393EA16
MSGPLKLKKANPQRLRSPGLSEAWLQQQIAADPTFLGFGGLTVFQEEKTQPAGGRIDFIMSDALNAGLEASDKRQASIQMFLKPEQIKQHPSPISDVLKAAEQWSHR